VTRFFALRKGGDTRAGNETYAIADLLYVSDSGGIKDRDVKAKVKGTQLKPKNMYTLSSSITQQLLM